MRAVKDQAILPVVTDKMMGNVPAFFRGVLLSDFPHGAGFDELAHFCLTGDRLPWDLPETPLSATQHRYD